MCPPGTQFQNHTFPVVYQDVIAGRGKKCAHDASKELYL